MHLKPRNPRRDRLVNEPLAAYSYFQIGAGGGGHWGALWGMGGLWGPMGGLWGPMGGVVGLYGGVVGPYGGGYRAYGGELWGHMGGGGEL